MRPRASLAAARTLVLLFACTAAQPRDAPSAIDAADRVCVPTKPTGRAERLICLSLDEIDRALPTFGAWRAQQGTPSPSATAAPHVGPPLDAGPDQTPADRGAGGVARSLLGRRLALLFWFPAQEDRELTDGVIRIMERRSHARRRLQRPLDHAPLVRLLEHIGEAA